MCKYFCPGTYENGFAPGEEVVGGGIGALWTDNTTETAPVGETYLGRYSKNTGSVLNLEGLDAGTKKVTVSFDLYIIGSWDGNHVVSDEEAEEANPKDEGDYFSFAVTGGETFLDTSFSNSDTKFTNRWQAYSPDDINGDSAPVSFEDAIAQITGYAPGTGSEYYDEQTGTWIDRNPLGFSAISGDPYHKNSDKQAIYRNLTFTFDYTDDQLGLEFLGNTTARSGGLRVGQREGLGGNSASGSSCGCAGTLGWIGSFGCGCFGCCLWSEKQEKQKLTG